MKKIFVYLLLLTLLGCADQHAKNAPHEVFPLNPLVINMNEDFGSCRLSITEVFENDSTVIYKAVSTYQHKDAGLLIIFPKTLDSKGYGTNMVFKSIGPASDRLLMILANLYHVKISSTARFITQISFDYVDLDIFSGTIQKKKEEKLKIGGDYKLFFPGDSSPEIFLNVDAATHSIEIAEKDAEYRQAIINELTR